MKDIVMTREVILFSPSSQVHTLPHVTLESGIPYQQFIFACIVHNITTMTPKLVKAKWVRAPICKSTPICEPFKVRWYNFYYKVDLPHKPKFLSDPRR